MSRIPRRVGFIHSLYNFNNTLKQYQKTNTKKLNPLVKLALLSIMISLLIQFCF